MNNNIFLKKMINEALDELDNGLNLDYLPGDDENFELEDFLDGDDDEYDHGAEFDNTNDGEDAYAFGYNGRLGKNYGTDAYTKGKKHYEQLLKDRLHSDRFEELMKDPSVTAFFQHPRVTNPNNEFTEKDDYLPNMFGRIQVTGVPGDTKKYNEPVFVVSLYNIEPQDVQDLAGLLPKRGKTLACYPASTRELHGKDGVTMLVPQKKLQSWKETEIPFLIEFLKERNKSANGTPKYGEEQDFENLQKFLENRVWTMADIDKSHFESTKNFSEFLKRFLESENDDELNDMLSVYARYGISEEMCKDLNLPASYGHILSWRNVKAVIYSGRNATFILPEKTWRRLFGRLVKPDAKPFFINVPSTKNWNGKWKNKTPLPYTYIDPDDGTYKTINLSSTEDILNTFYDGRPYDDLSSQQKMRVNTIANDLNVRNTTRIPEYDVSDTVWDPNLKPVDVFNEEIGLLNNLTGELNAKAKEDLENRLADKKNNKDDNEDTVDVNLSDAKIAMSTYKTKIAFKNLSDFARQKKVHVNDGNGDVSTAFVNTLRNVAEKLIPKRIGVTNKEEKDRLINNIIYLICRYLGIALSQVEGFRRKLRDEVDSNMISEIDVVLSELMDAVIMGVKDKDGDDTYKTALEESKNMSLRPHKSFHDVLYAFFEKLNKEVREEKRKNINETFYSMLNRMENAKKNLL
jgi:hypothetical protein